MAVGSNGYRAALVSRQRTPGLISSSSGTAGLRPFISFSTSYPELPPMPNWMARRLLSQRASAGGKPGSSGAREPAATKKPWGRFWYRGTPNQALQQTAGACRLSGTIARRRECPEASRHVRRSVHGLRRSAGVANARSRSLERRGAVTDAAHLSQRATRRERRRYEAKS